jgi:hypothetical protein
MEMKYEIPLVDIKGSKPDIPHVTDITAPLSAVYCTKYGIRSTVFYESVLSHNGAINLDLNVLCCAYHLRTISYNYIELHCKVELYGNATRHVGVLLLVTI